MFALLKSFVYAPTSGNEPDDPEATSNKMLLGHYHSPVSGFVLVESDVRAVGPPASLSGDPPSRTLLSVAVLGPCHCTAERRISLLRGASGRVLFDSGMD